MPIIFKNNAASLLAVQAQLSDITLTVTNGTGSRFPSPAANEWFFATIQVGVNYEIVKCTARAGDVLTVDRAQDGTSARLWGIGASIDMRIPKIVLEAFVQNGPPTGSVMEYYGAVAPTGWLFVDGAAHSRTVYAALFALLGTAHGEGDGVTTFNLPDRRNRFGVGAGGTYPLASTGGGTSTSSAGAHSHGGATAPTALTIAQMPTHTHGVNDPGHAHATVSAASDGNFGPGGAAPYPSGITNTAGSNTGITINNEGGGASHNHTIASDGAHTHTITPPYLASNYIIKT
jgi:microcystin-dependent protein